MPFPRRFGPAVLGLALAAFLTAASDHAQEAVSLDKLLPNDTEMVLVVKVRAILDSPLVKNAGLTANVKELLGSVEEVDTVLKELNFDPLKDIEQITVAICSGSDTDKGLIVVRGKFDVDKLKARADQAAKENKDILTVHKAPGGHTVYEVAPPGSDQTLFVAVANNTTLVLGPAKDYVLDALDKEAGKKTTKLKNKEVQELLGRLDPKLMVALALPGQTIGQSPLLQGEAKGIVDQIQDVVAGVVIDKDVKGQLAVTAVKAEDAASLHKLIKELTNNGTALLSVIANEQPQLEPVLDLVKSIKPKLKDKTITIEATVGGDLIEKILKNAKP